MSLWSSLAEPVTPNAKVSTWQDGGFRRRTWSDLVTSAEGIAAGLRRRGVEPGSRVGCVLTNSFEVYAGILGIWWAGAVLLSYPTPARGVSIEGYLGELKGLCKASGASVLVLEDSLARGVQFDDGPSTVGFAELAGSGRLAPAFPAEDELAFVQYSSGSTSSPKGCALTPKAMAAQVGMLSHRMELDPASDHGYSWLPLSHDMGLFGSFLTAWVAGAPLTLSTPTRFLRSPRTWLDDCAETGATITVGPNFGLAIALRAARRRAPSGPLQLRCWVVGSDPVEAALLDDAAELLAPHGIKPSTFMPAYGLAEATLAVTMTEPSVEPKTLTVAVGALCEGELRDPSGSEPSTRMVSTGPPMPGVQLQVAGPGRVGEIIVRSASLASGYLNDPERSARSFHDDGSLHTGDLGFLHDGELYVTGREDDMMSVGGRNVHTALIDSQLGQDPRIRSGSAILIDLNEDGRRHLAVVAEPVDNDIDFAAAARSMRQLVASEGGIGIQECVFVSRGALPKSPSGKIQRFRCRKLVSAGDAQTLARVHVG
jgi:fatty-acyl-CoA synthase